MAVSLSVLGLLLLVGFDFSQRVPVDHQTSGSDRFPLIASSVVIIAAMHERGVCGSSATPASHAVPQMPSRPKKGL